MKKMFVVALVLALAACGGKKKTDNTMKPGSGSAMTGSGDGGGSGGGSGDGGGGGGGSAEGGGGGQ